MDVAVEAATGADVAVVAALARRARDDLRAYRGAELFLARESLPEPLEESFAALLADGRAVLLVGTIDGTPMGYAAVTEDRGLAVVREIAVDEGAREVAIGEALLDGAIAWAREHGCTGIDSFALPGARDTKNFFERAGMKARLLVVHAPL